MYWVCMWAHGYDQGKAPLIYTNTSNLSLFLSLSLKFR